MKKSMKVILIAWGAAVVVLTALSWGWIQPDLQPDDDQQNVVSFVNNCSSTAIYSVLVDCRIGDNGSQKADGTALDQWEELYFVVSDSEGVYLVYPLTVSIYSGLNAEGELASCVISEAPPEGEHWQVRALNGTDAPELTVTSVPLYDEADITPEVVIAMAAMILFVVLPFTGLIGLWAVALVQLPGERRRGLLTVGIAVFVVAGVLFGGNWLLGQFGLTWRFAPLWAMSLLLWGLGWAVGVLTVRYTDRWSSEQAPGKGGWLMALSLVCLLAAMSSGTVWGGLWTLDWSVETVGECEGRTAVQTYNGEMAYQLYAYYGPVVRGVEPLAWGEESFFPSLYGADRDLGLDLSAGEIVWYWDDHGWMGDGVTYVVVQFDDDSLEAQLSDWKPLPAPEDIQRVIWRVEKRFSFAQGVEQGYYWFWDDQNEDDPTDASQMFEEERYSSNYAIAVYDSESRTLYYYKLDT